LVLFKSPRAQVASDVRHEGVSVERAVRRYVRFYRRAREWVDGWCRSAVFMAYERLAVDHDGQLRALCSALDLVEPEGDVALDGVGYHHVGGSPSARRSATVDLDERWRRDLSPRQLDAVLGETEAARIFNEMRELAL
jgi:hypothetical protein